MNFNYVAIVKHDIEKLLAIGFIQPVEEATWLSPTMVIPKKNGKQKNCVDFRKLNKATEKDPYILPFFNEVQNTLARYETYSFLDGYFGYHQIFIAFEDKYKTTFIINWGAFVWMVMPYGPPTFQRIDSRAFKKCLDQFMKIFVNDFMVYNDTESHLMKLRLCFKKCKQNRTSFNPKKCAFMIFSRLILGFIVSKEGKIPHPKKV